MSYVPCVGWGGCCRVGCRVLGLVVGGVWRGVPGVGGVWLIPAAPFTRPGSRGSRIVFVLCSGVVLCAWSFCAHGAVVGSGRLIPAVPFTLPGSRCSRVVEVVVYVLLRSVVL